MRKLVVTMAAVQIVDAVGNEIPRQLVRAHLDHLGVPMWLRRLLPLIKVSSSAALLLGLKDRRVAALTSALLVAYYAAATRFHLLSGDHPVLALPAVALGAGAAVNLCVELDGVSVSAAED
ncbi:MAG: DoxX family protein [Actinobacteria bacterium]|nr:DoxX family protein [Actinomycetota bacterium]MBV9933280.1 DoxX family protein [Actinomycetota bacterium]